MSVSLDTEKCCGIFLSSDRENLLSNIFVSMSRQCQKLQLLIDHMAVSLKNKFACATVCICVGWFFVAVASSGGSSVRCHNYNEVRCSRALILLAFSSSSPCACCTPKRGTHTHTHTLYLPLSLSRTHICTCHARIVIKC